MKNAQLKTISLVLTLCLLAAIGCTRYAITTELESQFVPGSGLSIGAIVDDLPLGTPDENKPTIENIDYFKEQLSKELDKRDIFSGILIGHETPEYELTGSILDYKKGSGFLRFMFGFGIGAAKVTISLELRDVKDGHIVFGGNFIGSVTSEFSKGDKMFKNVAKDFAKAIEKALRKQEKIFD